MFNNNNKGDKMNNKSIKALKEVRELAKQNKFVEAKKLLNKYSYLCDVDSEFWNVYQGLHILYREERI
tara:strand:- start:702 stop:905 length:204 start_codon:yes stop_codon:yes gene_type:complete